MASVEELLHQIAERQEMLKDVTAKTKPLRGEVKELTAQADALMRQNGQRRLVLEYDGRRVLAQIATRRSLQRLDEDYIYDVLLKFFGDPAKADELTNKIMESRQMTTTHSLKVTVKSI